MENFILSNGQKLDNFTAIGIAEGLIKTNDSDNILIAWSYIGKNKLYLILQGWFGRQLAMLIEQNYLDKNFNII